MIASHVSSNYEITQVTGDLLKLEQWCRICFWQLCNPISVTVFCFSPHLFSFGLCYKTIRMCLANQSIIFINFPLFNQQLNHRILFLWTISGITHFTQIIRELSIINIYSLLQISAFVFLPQVFCQTSFCCIFFYKRNDLIDLISHCYYIKYTPVS